jgi:O-acetyl-ADP-ribose deacetylase (regulator of RNase III)
VDGAIHRRGGPAILEECRAIRAQRGSLPAGEAVIATGGNLSARFVIHTVGPVWRGGGSGEAQTLASCYRQSLKVATEKGFRSISFPAISTGVYGYPVEEAAEIAVGTIAEVLKGPGPAPDLVRVVRERAEGPVALNRRRPATVIAARRCGRGASVCAIGRLALEETDRSGRKAEEWDPDDPAR